MNTILHITQWEKWKQAQLAGMYRADSLDSEGFIHCSTPKQIIKVGNNFFAHQKGLVLLFIDSDQVKAEIRYEAAEVDELFSHIYGALNIDAVFKFVDFNPGKDGFFQMCPELQEISE